MATRPMSVPSPRPASTATPSTAAAGMAASASKPATAPAENIFFILVTGLRVRPAKLGRRALPPALARNSFGCFLPDLTRFTTVQCGEARHQQIVSIIHRRDHPPPDSG